jgi:voltage-gated potassium channel
MQAERRLTSAMLFRTVGLATVFLVVIAGAAQAELDNDEFKSFWDGVWWAMVTVTTVGYGDLYPSSVAGRLIAIVVMLMGIGFLAVLTATISSQFVKADQGDDNAEILRMLRQIEADVADLKTRLGSSRY